MISEKIKNQIYGLDISIEMKELMIKILEEEDKGIYKYKEVYDKLINDYIDKEEETADDSN